MFCTKCGKQIEDDSQFCVYCGAPLAVNQRKAQAAAAECAPTTVLSVGAQEAYHTPMVETGADPAAQYPAQATTRLDTGDPIEPAQATTRLDAGDSYVSPQPYAANQGYWQDPAAGQNPMYPENQAYLGAAEMRPRADKPKKKRALPVVIAVVAVLLVGAAGVLAWNYMQGDKATESEPAAQVETASDTNTATNASSGTAAATTVEAFKFTGDVSGLTAETAADGYSAHYSLNGTPVASIFVEGHSADDAYAAAGYKSRCYDLGSATINGTSKPVYLEIYYLDNATNQASADKTARAENLATYLLLNNMQGLTFADYFQVYNGTTWSDAQPVVVADDAAAIKTTDGSVWGVWLSENYSSLEQAESAAKNALALGYDGCVFKVSDWSGLAQGSATYRVTCGTYMSENQAQDGVATIRSTDSAATAASTGTPTRTVK